MAEAQPLLQHVDFSEDVSPGNLHGQAAQQQKRGIEIENGREQHGMPVTDLLMGTRIHVGARLAREEQRHQDGEEHHVCRENGKDRKANLVKELARTSALMLPIIIASASSAASGPPVNRRFAANSWLFPFRFRRGMRKGSGHSDASVQIRVHHKALSQFQCFEGTVTGWQIPGQEASTRRNQERLI